MRRLETDGPIYAWEMTCCLIIVWSPWGSRDKKIQKNLCPEVKVKVTQSCLTLCDPSDYKVHGTVQARILEWVAFPFSRGSSQPRNRTRISCIAGRFFTNWATREALICVLRHIRSVQRTSLVVQWLRILSWFGKIPHAAGPLCPCVTTTEPSHPEPVGCSERSPHGEKPADHNREHPPPAATRESPCAATKTQHSQR